MNQTDGEMLKYLAHWMQKTGTFGNALRIAIDLDDYDEFPPTMRAMVACTGASVADGNIPVRSMDS
jgi:hypothetical protein